MSLFKTYSPKSLFLSTLKLANCLFRRPPVIEAAGTTYFRYVLQLHGYIRQDMDSMFTVETTECESTVSIAKIYQSLSELEKILLGSSSLYKETIEGCERYTNHIREQLNHSDTCTVV